MFGVTSRYSFIYKTHSEITHHITAHICEVGDLCLCRLKLMTTLRKGFSIKYNTISAQNNRIQEI